MSRKIKRAVKAAAFLLIATILFGICSFIFQPIWYDVLYNSTHGIYKEPKNSIETLFLGSSQVYSGVSPMQLYEEYGICAYDLTTNSQPMSASYYWLEEVYQRQSDALDTVVLDIGLLKREPLTSHYHESIDSMRFSIRKLRAVKSYSKTMSKFLANLFPMISYHDRWKELTEEDFQKFSKEPDLYLRGFYFRTSQWVNSAEDYSELSTPLRILDESAQETELNAKSLDYFDKIVAFCEDHDIQLVLIKTPTDWSSSDHNAVQSLADSYGLDFLDFNIDPYYSEIGFDLAADVIVPTDLTNLHSNYYGATKLTDYLGQYLTDVCGNRDVRGDETYSFMDEELADYHRYIISTDFQQFTDPCDYIEYALEQGDFTILISVKDEAAAALTDEQRERFASAGLTQLSELSNHDSYLAVIEDGSVITEQTMGDPGATETETEEDPAISWEGTLPDGTTCSVTSGGYYLGNISSILIDEVEYSYNKRGLNIVLYDNTRGEIIDRAYFDTHDSSERKIQNVEQRLFAELANGADPADLSGTDLILYQYDRACENEKTAAILQNAELSEWLSAFGADEDYDICLSVKGNASQVLTEESRKALNELGLSELAELDEGDSYVAVISGGGVALEMRDSDGNAVDADFQRYTLSSAVDTVSIQIDGTEYALGDEGVNLVVWDDITESVVASVSFSAETAS